MQETALFSLSAYDVSKQLSLDVDLINQKGTRT
jgi:hypothetical protein